MGTLRGKHHSALGHLGVLCLLRADGQFLLAVLMCLCGGLLGLGRVEAHLAVRRLGDAPKLLDERLAPPGAGVLAHVLGQLLVVELALLIAHGDGVVDRVGQLLRVPRVDDQAAVQALCRARELGEDHDAVALLLCGDVLVGHQVHAVSCRGDEADVRDRVEGDQLVEGHGLVHEVDWHELDGAELAVDAPDKLVDDSAEVLVLFDVLARGHSDLHQDNLANPLRVLSKEDLESVQLLRYTLDVVQTVNTDNKLDTLELLLKSCDALLDLGLLQPLVELLGVDTDGEGTDGNDLALELNAIRSCRQTPKQISIRIISYNG